MRFMMLMMPGAKAEREGFFASPEMFEAMVTFNEEMAAAGVMLSGEGLLSTARGARVTFAGGKPAVTDGPFTETREIIGGYWIIQASSLDEAVAWAVRCPAAADEMIEVRQIAEMSDFPDEIVALVGDREAVLAEQLNRA